MRAAFRSFLSGLGSLLAIFPPPDDVPVYPHRDEAEALRSDGWRVGGDFRRVLDGWRR
jgi:hypothetical protein